jgi:cobalt-zinc-cadmium efflux system membrane fusion protein
MDDQADHVGVLEQDSATEMQANQPEHRTPLLNRLGRGVPPLLVFAALGGLALWGHHTGWKMPTFATLMGEASQGKDDWCAQHNVPDSQCVECKADLMPRSRTYGWCREHGVHECPLCHPEIAQLSTTPKVSAEDKVRARRALALTERPENNSKCKLQKRRIQFVSTAAVDKAGIEVEPVWQAPMVETVTANGEVGYDQTLVARLSSRLPGTIWRVEKQVGDRVRRGDVLALVETAEVGRAKAEFLQAFVQVQLKVKNLESVSAARGAIPDRTIRETEAALSEARIRLATARQTLINLGLPVDADILKGAPENRLAERIQFLGLPEYLAKNFDPTSTTSNLLPIKATFDGVVVSRAVVAGEVVDTTKVLFVVADTRRLWLTLDVRMEDAKALALGQQVHFRPDGNKSEMGGQITWISTEIDHKTRTLQVRATLANADGGLRANTFGTGRIVLRDEKQAVVVPHEAIQWEGDCYVVFVRDKNFLKEGSPKVFHTRTVRLGAKDDQNTEIIAGVLPGELVATKGSAVLKAELLRGNLGEG